MGCDIHIDDARGVAVLCLTGPVTAVEFEQAFERLVAHAGFRAGMPRLWDAREADLSGLTRDDFRRMADGARAIQVSSPGVRVAFVVARDIDFGILRMFDSWEGEGLPASMRLFRDLESARAWISPG